MNCFTKTHVISEDAADAALIQTDHPVKADQLVILEDSALQDGGLLGQPCKNILVMLLLFDHVLNFLILLFKVAAPLGLDLGLLAEDLMLGEEEIGIVFCLFDQTFDGLFGCGVWCGF